MAYVVVDNGKAHWNKKKHLTQAGRTLCRLENIDRKHPLRLRAVRPGEKFKPCAVCHSIAAHGPGLSVLMGERMA